MKNATVNMSPKQYERAVEFVNKIIEKVDTGNRIIDRIEKQLKPDKPFWSRFNKV